MRSGVCMGLGIAYAGCDKEEAVELLQVRAISISFLVFSCLPCCGQLALVCFFCVVTHTTRITPPPPHTPPSSLTWMMT